MYLQYIIPSQLTKWERRRERKDGEKEPSSIYLLHCYVMPMVQDVDLGPKVVEKRFEKLPHAKQKVTKFHFYFHNILRGMNPIAVQDTHSQNNMCNIAIYNSTEKQLAMITTKIN